MNNIDIQYKNITSVLSKELAVYETIIDLFRQKQECILKGNIDNLKSIVEEIQSYDCDRVIFTGGEPAIQDLATIGGALKSLGMNLSIETNGTIPVDPIIDWICVSPKDQLYPNLSIKQRTGDELKIVYCGQELSMYDDLRTGFSHSFLQPCYIESDSVEQNGVSFQVVEKIVKKSPGWRLSLQTHKWMGVL